METVKYEIELNAELAQKLIEAFSYQYSYSPTVKGENGEDIENPKTAVDNWRECTARYWQDVLNGYSKSKAIKEVEESFQAAEVSLNVKSV